MRRPRTLLLSAMISFTVGAEAGRSEGPAMLERRREVSPLKKDVPSTWAVAFSPDGALLAVGGTQEVGNCGRERVALLDARTMKVLRLFDGDLCATSNPEAISVAVTPGNRFVAAAVHVPFESDLSDRVMVWEVASGKLVSSFAARARGANCLASSPRQALLAYSQPDGTINLWEPDARRERALFPPRALLGYFETALAFSHDGNVLAVAEFHAPLPRLPSGNCLLKLWRVDEGREIVSASLGNRQVTGLSFSPDGSTLISTDRIDNSPHGLENVCTIRDAATLKERLRLPSGGSSLSAAVLAVSPDGSLLLTGVASKDRLCLWGLAEGRALSRPKGAETDARSLSFSPDGKMVASAGGHSGLHLWDVRGGKE